MGLYKGIFKLVIMSSKTLIYENEVHSVFVTGNQGEYELLAYHYPVIGVLVRSNIVIDWKESIPIKSGTIRFMANECVILIEEEEKKVTSVKQTEFVNKEVG